MTITDNLFRKYERMLHKLAWNHCQRVGIEEEALFEEAMFIFCKAVQAFDPNNGTKLSTYIYCAVNRELYNYCKGQLNHYSGLVSIDEFVSVEVFAEVMDLAMPNRSELELILLDSIASDLSGDAQLVLQDLFAGAFHEVVEVNRPGRPYICSHDKIRNRYHWTHSYTTQIRNEIKDWWAEYQAA